MITGAAAGAADGCADVVAAAWPHTPRSVGRSRRLLVRHLDAWGLTRLADTAELVLSELVTNAVTHARPPYGHVIATRFVRLKDGVRIEVHDANDRKPQCRQAGADEESGRGLALVDALTAGDWGVSDREGIGKMVWAGVRMTPSVHGGAHAG